MAAERYAVILAGGKGERFWPLSTARRPKQMLALAGDTPLLAQAVDRLDGLVPAENVFVITNADLVEACAEAATRVPRANIIGEPVGRDTAPAVALGGAMVRAKSPDASFCVITADHIIGDLEAYRATLRAGMELAARRDVLITIGIPPTMPSTGFGYIEADERLEDVGGIAFLRARRFVEKPDRETAEAYLAAGSFYWNSGIFVWSATGLHAAFARHRPDLAALMDRLTEAAREGDIEEVLRDIYPGLEKISIDYALMESAQNIVMAKGAFAWDDVGAWTALANHFPADAAGNVPVGRVEALDATGNIVYSRDRLTALVGVKDLVVVQAEGVTLVCHRDRCQEIKTLVRRLRESSAYEEYL